MRPFLTALVAVGIATSPALAGSPAGMVADGKPWAVETTEGRRATLVLNPDGTGRMTGGPMALSPTWTATADGLCLNLGMMLGERCVRLVRTEDGFDGLEGDTLAMRLRR